MQVNTLISREGLVNWYFEPSQPQRITSGLKTMFNLSPISLPSTEVIKPQIIQKQQNQSWHKCTENIHRHQTNFFLRISPFGIAPVKTIYIQKKHITLGHAGIVNHSVDLSIPDFFLSIYKNKKKEWTEAIKTLK